MLVIERSVCDILVMLDAEFGGCEEAVRMVEMNTDSRSAGRMSSSADRSVSKCVTGK